MNIDSNGFCAAADVFLCAPAEFVFDDPAAVLRGVFLADAAFFADFAVVLFAAVFLVPAVVFFVAAFFFFGSADDFLGADFADADWLAALAPDVAVPVFAAVGEEVDVVVFCAS